MADFNAGDITASLKIDLTNWQRGLQQAQQQLQQFGQAKDKIVTNLARLQQGLQQNQQALTVFNQRTQQGNQIFQQFNQTFNQTNQTFQHFTTNISNATHAIHQAGAAAQRTSGLWSTMLQIAGGIGIATSVSAIVSGLKSLATESIQAAARMETLRAQFTALQGQSRAAVTLQTLFTTAQRLGVEFGTLANAFRGFDAATQGTALEGAKAQRVFEQITTGMRGMGASSEQVGRALLALQQMVSKGTVSQEELRQQLGEALPGAMGIAARAMGVTTQELNKMIEKGQESTGFVVAFANQVEREFGGKAATATNTLTAAWQRFSNELEQFSGSLAGGQLVGQLRDLANWAAKFLETVRQGRELREEALGGPAPAIPPEMVGMRTLEARQKEIEALRRTVAIGERGFAYPGEVPFFGGMPTDAQIEEARTKLRELQKIQADAIQRMRDQWAAEAEQPLVVPGARQVEALRKIQDDLQKQLRDIDLTADFVTPLELAEERLKAIEKAFENMRKIVPQIGEGLRHTLIPSGTPSPYDAMFEAAAAKYRLDPNVLRALGEQESGLRPDVVSRKGAVGIMQIMPGTAAQYGGAGANLKDAATNIELGAKIFADLMKRFDNNLTKALTAYNAGPGRGGIPLPTGENATFARDVLRRIPREPGDILRQTEAQRRAAEQAVEAEKPDTERLARIREIGREDIAAIEARARAREQAITTEISLTQDLARVRAFVTGKEETAAEQARARVQAQGEAMRATIEQALRQFEQSPALAERAPGLRKQLEDLKAALPGAIEAEGLRAFNEALHRDAIAPLENLREKVELTKDERDLLTVAQIRARYADNAVVQAQADLTEASIKAAAALKAETEVVEKFNAIKLRTKAILDAEEAQRTQFGVKVLQAQSQVGVPRAERPALRLRAEAQREGIELTPELEEQLDVLTELHAQQERLNYAVGIYEDIAQGIGSAWTGALTSIADGTRTVGEAFREMGRTMLQTMAQIAAQEAFRGLLRLGVGLLTGGLTPSVAQTTAGGAIYQGTAGGGAPLLPPLMAFQHGGIVNRRTLALIGEGPPHTLPETVLNRQQMQSLMRSGPSAGGQAAGGNISIINVANRAQAEQEAASQRAMGHQVIINEVLSDLGRGESSSINRMIRTLSR